MTDCFNIFPWDRPFLPLLKDFVAKADTPLSRLVIVFPHNRPRRYLLDLYRQDAENSKRTILLPRILTLGEIVDLYHLRAAPARYAAKLPDLVVLLHKIVTAGRSRGDLGQLCRMDLDAFLPWGVRLAALFEECFLQMAAPANIAHAEDLPEAAMELLGGLGDFYTAYINALKAEGWITPGLKAAEAAAAAQDIPSTLLPATNVFLAGFAALTGSENAILRALWDAGAKVCLHTDCAGLMAQSAAQGSGPAGEGWSCQAHAAWIRSWGARISEFCAPAGRKPEIFYFAGHDLHSQLAELPAMLEGEKSTVIALCRDELLLPVLHALPEKDVNVSLGYPLERSPLCRLLESIMRLRESGRADGAFHWRIVREVMQHPYLHMLAPAAAEKDVNGAAVADKPAFGKAESLRMFFHRLERKLRTGRRFVHPNDLLVETTDGLSAEAIELLERLFACIFNKFAAYGVYGTLYDLGAAVEELCAILLTHGGEVLRRFPIDAECFCRLRDAVIPLLKDSLLAKSPLSMSALHQMLREAVAAERVPFEAEPISGVQVLGMLETRLLHFERVILLDAVDEALPGSTPQSPLLPDSLRPLLGLPSAHSREITSAHTLHRLLAGAETAHILWQEGVGNSAMSEGKSARSRFVDELIWREEKKRGRLLQDGVPPLGSRIMAIRPFGAKRPILQRTNEIDIKIGEIMRRPLSPTLLDVYTACPANFIYSYVLRVEPREEVNEGDDPLEVGELLHKALHEAYQPFVDRELRPGDILEADMADIFRRKMDESNLRENLPPQSAVFLEIAAPYHLGRYLERQPEGIRVKALEQRMHAKLRCAAGEYTLHGTLDRLDERPGGMYIVDYKTGGIPALNQDVWTDKVFWSGISGAAPADCGALRALEEGLKSLQLPCYVYLTGQSDFGSAHDAVWVELRDKGEENFLFGDKIDDYLRQAAIKEHIPAAFAFVLGHMATAEDFPAFSGKKCQWCAYRRICNS